MNTSITKSLKQEIKANENKISELTETNEKLSAALAALEGSSNGNGYHEEEELVREKRKYTKRKWGKRAKRKKYARKPRKIEGKTGKLKWNDVIIPFFDEGGKLATIEQMVDALFPGKHHKTKSVLTSRLRSTAYNWKNKGILKSWNSDEGSVYFGTPKLFHGAEPIEAARP